MNPFEDHCTDTIHISRGGHEIAGPIKASFGQRKFTVFDDSLDISEGDIILRPLPNGKAEQYNVLHVEFTQEFHGIPANFQMTVEKRGSLIAFGKKVVNVSISNSHGFQVGDHNTQNIVDAFKQVIEKIEKSEGTPQEKAEAKSRLKAFVEHPLTNSVIGSTISGLLPLLAGK